MPARLYGAASTAAIRGAARLWLANAPPPIAGGPRILSHCSRSAVPHSFTLLGSTFFCRLPEILHEGFALGKARFALWRIERLHGLEQMGPISRHQRIALPRAIRRKIQPSSQCS